MPKNVSLTAIMYDMQMLRYATARQIGYLHWGPVPPGKSRQLHQTSAGQRLNKLVELGKLEKVGDKPAVYRLPDLRGKGDEHALKVTDVLVDIRRMFRKTIFIREYPIFDSTPDALVLVRTRDRLFPFILEVMLNETKQSIESKLEDYTAWDGDWFRQYGVNHAGVVVIGDVELNEDFVVVARKFTEELLWRV